MAFSMLTSNPLKLLMGDGESDFVVTLSLVHQDSTMLNVKLQLFALIAKQPVFHQLRSVEQLGYITMLTQSYDSGIQGLQFIVQSTAKSNVNALIEMKLEKPKNLSEETSFYWGEFFYGTLKFDRSEIEVSPFS
ncbi:insulin-degrading enzyme-like 1, peroxisomal [Papaver somniferum]|uniref:insulin-degrading enzyme-like 1, peroxisomal n=1 Tax=Papaver somniferum TaxID=3469 RepID=UPI000E6F5B4B|nr:insulin-degrading enzyme-like 1, peroxisomal [Papaver somniferum]